MPKFDDRPQLVNRGAAGLVAKVSTPDSQKKAETQTEKEERILRESPKNRIAPSLKPLIVPIDSLTPDPNNAKKHPEKSIRAIMLSLALFGQRKPLAAHKDVGAAYKEGGIVIAGNGTLEAAKLLGWTKIAAAMDDDLSEAELAAYGMADNRSAEHGRWDFEQVAKLEQLIAKTGGKRAGVMMVGWSIDELEVLRAADWTAPEMAVFQPLDQTDYEAMWQGMPEFVQEDQSAVRRLIVNFKTMEDFIELLKLMGQTPSDITNANSLWFPKAERPPYKSGMKYLSTKEGE